MENAKCYAPQILVGTEGLPREQWLEYRRKGIGGSDAAAVLGISPFRTGRDLYYDKLNIVTADDAENWVQLEVGTLLEPLVAKIFAHKTGYKIYRRPFMFRHPQYPWMLADLDYMVELSDGTSAILEIKTTNYNAKDNWWYNGEEIVPIYYESQGRHYMAVMNIDRVYFCCLYGNSEDEAIIRRIDRDMAYEEELIALERDFWENHVLTKTPPPYEEPNFLLKDEVQSANSYFSIIRAIADGNHKLGKIAGALGMETSSLTPYLSTLIDLDFLKKATPVTEKNPEKSRKGLYFISDNFIRFWFRYVYPYKGELELDNQQIVLDELEKDFIQKFVAFSYEDVCKDIFASLCRSKAVDFAPSRIGSYWLNDINGDTEIDVMAVDHQKKQVFAGECKYHNKPVDATVYYELEEKVKKSAELRTAFPGYKILYGLFSKSGFTQRMLDQAEGRDDILLIQEDHIL